MELTTPAIDLLNSLADSCGDGEAAAWWILTSAAAHLKEEDSGWIENGRGSTVAAWLAGTVQR
jgi:hypothetical protein